MLIHAGQMLVHAGRHQVGLFYRIVSYEDEYVSISSILCLTRDSHAPPIIVSSLHDLIMTLLRNIKLHNNNNNSRRKSQPHKNIIIFIGHE